MSHAPIGSRLTLQPTHKAKAARRRGRRASDVLDLRRTAEMAPIKGGDIGEPRRTIEVEPMPTTVPATEPAPALPDREKVPA
jgi:hypothetical protein